MFEVQNKYFCLQMTIKSLSGDMSALRNKYDLKCTSVLTNISMRPVHNLSYHKVMYGTADIARASDG
jgi:hypothetical protein